QKIHEIKSLLEAEPKKKEKAALKLRLRELDKQYTGNTIFLAQELEKATSLESRVTILGHLQRGGTPSAADRLLATRLGTACADYIHKEQYGNMVAVKGGEMVLVPLKDVVGKIKLVPADHAWVKSAREVGTCMGDE
ncbi:MAG: 6-phosphofructokinase, partial [Bacteroidetes bacterium]